MVIHREITRCPVHDGFYVKFTRIARIVTRAGLLFVSRSDTRKPSRTRSPLVSRLECAPPVIISCLAGQTAARAPPCLKRPNCPPRICSANTFGTPYKLLSLVPLVATFQLVRGINRSLSRCQSHRASSRWLLRPPARGRDNCRHAILFFVCPHNSTPLPIFSSNLVFLCSRRVVSRDPLVAVDAALR